MNFQLEPFPKNISGLAPSHIEDLRKSGLSDETIQEAGLKSVPPRLFKEILDHNAKIESMYLIPYPGTDFSRYKLFPPFTNREGHSQKYHQPKDSAPRLYVPPGFDCTAPLWRITEGEKKALKATQEKLNCLGLGGIWNFATKNGNGQPELIPDLKNIPWKNKTVEIIPDADFKTNDHVKRAVYRLAQLLEAEGATVFIVELPGGLKLDDYLCEHTAADFEKLPRITHKTKDFISAKIAEDLQKQQQDDELLFPDIYSGACGFFADELSKIIETPKSFLFMAALTCLGIFISKRVTVKSVLKPQPRLFLLLIGESGDEKKSTAVKETISRFREISTSFNIQRGVGSAEGLLAALNDSGVLLLVLDEFSQFVGKCNAQNSVLLPCTATLFENNDYANRTKNENIEIENAYLAILAASTRETFQRVWTPNFTNIGFDNRLLLIYEKATKSFPIPGTLSIEKDAEIKRRFIEILNRLPYSKEYELTPDAQRVYEEWYKDLKARNSIVKKRIDTYALRLMPLIAVNDGKDIIDADIIRRVIAFSEWQIKIRELMAPVDAINIVAELEEKIRRILKSKGSLKERDVQISVNAYRAGLHFYKCAVGNLIENQEVKRMKGFLTHTGK